MIEIKSKLRRWGNSLGIVIPQEVIEHEKAKEGDELKILIKKENDPILREMFGSYKFKEPVEKIMKEIDKELYDD